MDSGQVSSLANFIGIVTGGGALLGFALYRAHLPKWRYRGLEDVLKQTEEMWTAESHLIGTSRPENLSKIVLICMYSHSAPLNTSTIYQRPPRCLCYPRASAREHYFDVSTQRILQRPYSQNGPNIQQDRIPSS